MGDLSVADVLEGLAARCEAASELDRELDALIQIASTPDAQCMTHPGEGTRGSSFGPMSEIDHVAWRAHRSGLLGAFYYGEPPAYTSDLSAAMALVSDGLVFNGGNDVGPCWAHVWKDDPGYDGFPFEARARTLALALTAAALRAAAAAKARA